MIRFTYSTTFSSSCQTFVAEKSPSSLYVASGSDVSGNWEVVDASSPEPSSRFYLNVCHKVIQTGDAAGCPVTASICAVGKSFHKHGDFIR